MQAVVNRGVKHNTETLFYPLLGCGRRIDIVVIVSDHEIPVKRLKVAAEVCSFDDLQRTLDGLEEWLIMEYDRGDSNG